MKKKSSFEVVLSKVAQKEPRMRFFRYYQKWMHVTSLIFCKKLQWHKDLKWTSVFFGKSFVLEFLGQKLPKLGSKMRLFKFYEKSLHGDFLIFCMRLQQHKGLKWTQMGFFCGKSCTRIFGQKGDQNGFWGFWARMRVLSFMVNGSLICF